MVNTSVTSKEEILATCRKLVSAKGLSSLHMRAVAEACGVALGSLYYYFPSKHELLLAAIESVWEDIFRWQDTGADHLPFPQYIDRCFARIQAGIRKYPNFFTIHSISFSTKNQGKAYDSMQRYLGQIKEKMLRALRADEHVSKEAFSATFTEEDFVDFVLSNVMILLVQRQRSCAMLLEVICRTIYGKEMPV